MSGVIFTSSGNNRS